MAAVTMYTKHTADKAVSLLPYQVMPNFFTVPHHYDRTVPFRTSKARWRLHGIGRPIVKNKAIWRRNRNGATMHVSFCLFAKKNYLCGFLLSLLPAIMFWNWLLKTFSQFLTLITTSKNVKEMVFQDRAAFRFRNRDPCISVFVQKLSPWRFHH